MAETTLDEKSILANYQSTATFELIDTVEPEDEIQPGYLKSGAVQYSLVESSSRMLKVWSSEIAPFLSSAGVIGMVTSVSHGTFQTQPASLVIFSFALRSGDHGFRFKNANVKITFSKHSSAQSTDAGPAVIKFAPRKIYGLPALEGRKNTIGGELTLQVPAGPVTVGPSLKGERETEYEKQYRFKTVGNFWSSRNSNEWDLVYWDMRENELTKEGIPDRLNVAVVVDAPGPFVASVEVTVDTPFANGFLSNPWTKSRPAVFLPGVAMGHQPRTTKFDTLTQEEWKALIPYEEEWESRLTDVAEPETKETPVQTLQLTAVTDERRPSNEGVVGVDELQVSVQLLEEEESDDR